MVSYERCQKVHLRFVCTTPTTPSYKLLIFIEIVIINTRFVELAVADTLLPVIQFYLGSVIYDLFTMLVELKYVISYFINRKIIARL